MNRGVGTRVQPADSQPQEQQHQRHCETADAVEEERAGAADAANEPLKVLAEETGDECQRQEAVARIVSCSMVAFWRTLTFVCSTEITAMLASRTVPEVTLRGDLLVDQQQVILDVTQIRLKLRGGGPLDHSDNGEQRMDRTVEVGGLASQRVDPLGRRHGAREHGGLDLVDVTFEPGHNRRVPIHDLIQDRPER